MKKLSICALLFAACGSSITTEEATKNLAHALCTRTSACRPFLVSAVYGDVATCEARAALMVPPSLAAGSSLTPAQIDACARAYEALACDALLAGSAPPEACRPQPGTLADGTSCVDDWQCKSAYCVKSETGGCGVCGARGLVGESCADRACDYGLACQKATCVKPAALGQACSDTIPCTNGTCEDDVCTAWSGVGGPCGKAGGPSCDNLSGLVCGNVTAAGGGTCKQATLVAAGQPCGFVGGEFVGCSGSAFCKTDGDSATGTCLAAAADGAPCNATLGPRCAEPARCTDGVCKLPSVTCN